MNIAIVGYGKMGKIVRREAIAAGHTIVDIVDPFICEDHIKKSVEEIDVERCDVVVDFSIPSVVMENIRFYAESGLSAVVGTTGWYDRLSEVRSLVENMNGSIVYSANFSLGVAAFIKVAEYFSKIMNKLANYDVAIEEIHHREKKDSPSGTALILENLILSNIERKKRAVHGNIDNARSEDLQVSSLRIGSYPGTHRILFDSLSDSIELTHSARNRSGFAIGAIKAASWIKGRKGLFTFSDFIDAFLGGDDEV